MPLPVLPESSSYKHKYYYCDNCGHKRYSRYLTVTIPVEVDDDFIPDDSMIAREPIPPKWVRPTSCFIHLIEDFNIPWTRQDRQEFIQKDEDYENRIKEAYQKWQTWKNNKTPINLLETLEKNFGITKQELEYCIRRYQ